MESVSTFQLVLGALTVLASLNVVLAKNPVVSAMSLMATLFLTGALYFGLGFYFIGAAQILIYAGAISVLFVFIVMLLDLKPAHLKIPGRAMSLGMMALAGSLLLVSLGVPVFLQGALLPHSDFAQLTENASAIAIALRFLSKYMMPFQVTGLLIFGAIMGVILLGRRSSTGAQP